MKVILLQDVKKLGQEGDVVEVAEGYGRNYLIPKGMAELATSGGLRALKKVKEQEARLREKQKQQAQKLADKLNDKAVSITTKAGDKGRLFGSVTNKEIAEAIDEQYEVIVDRRKIELSEPIKALGDHPIKVKLHPQVVAEMIVRVVSE